jgi:sulfatase maturation enzyme AslB (radical SAM superfamily)
VQCKLNLQTDRFNLRRILVDELTTDQFRVFRNRWKWTYKQISSNSKQIADVDTNTDEFTTDQFMVTDDRGVDKLATYQFMSAGKKDTGELTTDQFTDTDTV